MKGLRWWMAVAFTFAAVKVAVVPITCVFPFLQKHYEKGILIGAINT